MPACPGARACISNQPRRCVGLAKDIDDDRKKTKAIGEAKTITLITIDDLARLVRLRPIKQLGLRKMRALFNECRLPEETSKWIDGVEASQVKKPPIKRSSRPSRRCRENTKSLPSNTPRCVSNSHTAPRRSNMRLTRH